MIGDWKFPEDMCDALSRPGKRTGLERMRLWSIERRKDPEYRERRRKMMREYAREKWRKDPEYRERVRKYDQERRKDPEVRERIREYQREYRREYCRDPEVQERIRERQRERRKNPEYQERARGYNRRYRQEYLKNPKARERKRASNREYMRKFKRAAAIAEYPEELQPHRAALYDTRSIKLHIAKRRKKNEK